MGDLKAIRFDIDQYKAELTQFYEEIICKDALAERDDILPFFYKRRYLLASIASYNPKVSRFDRVADELTLFEKFRMDAIAGDNENRAFCFIEFENADQTSIFISSPRRTPELSGRFKKGLMQLFDWFWTIDENKYQRDFIYKFGSDNISYVGLLVIGRGKYIIEDREKSRWNWLQDNLILNGKRIILVTYDQLYNDLNNRLNMYYTAKEPVPDIDENGMPRSE